MSAAIMIFEKAGVAQLVECKLPKLDVAGSSPVARSIHKRKKTDYRGQTGRRRTKDFRRCKGNLFVI